MINMTQIESARKSVITPELRAVAKSEDVGIESLMKDVAEGRTVIVKSALHDCVPLGIGKNLRVKVNSNIGTSNFCFSMENELEKLKASVKYGADTVMDLSTGGDISAIRKRMLSESKIPLGTVPIYEAIVRQPDVSKIKEEDFLDAIKAHVDDGVDFITVHCGITQKCIPFLKPRIMGVVSRGGSFLVKWMLYHKKENPLYTNFDKVVEIAKKHDVVLSLGDGLRPGCLADATDKAQIAELKVLGKLAKFAQDRGVQVIIEGPGHVPLNQIKKNVRMQKKYCNNAPFYVLGPLVTDIGAGYDHITGAIGGTFAAYLADFLCYLTPTEHLGLPAIEDVVDGVVASKIAAHAADIAHGIKNARLVDDEMSRARSNLDWEKMHALSLNPDKAREIREKTVGKNAEVCSMCGNLCSAKVNKECKGKY